MESLTFGAAVVLSLGLSACAGADTRSGRSGDAAPAAGVDYGKVVAVNQWAQRRGATLRWVHYPTVPPRDRNTDG